jgi:hypothetical protein
LSTTQVGFFIVTVLLPWRGTMRCLATRDKPG